MVFEDILGDSGELRIIEFLLPFKKAKFSIEQISDECNISCRAVKRIIDMFRRYGIVTFDEDQPANHFNINGGDEEIEWFDVKQYKDVDIKHISLNHESPFIKVIGELNDLLIETFISREYLDKLKELTEDEQ